MMENLSSIFMEKTTTKIDLKHRDSRNLRANNAPHAIQQKKLGVSVNPDSVIYQLHDLY